MGEKVTEQRRRWMKMIKNNDDENSPTTLTERYVSLPNTVGCNLKYDRAIHKHSKQSFGSDTSPY